MPAKWWSKYQPMCDLWIESPGHDQAQDYRRELALDTAVALVASVVAILAATVVLYVVVP